MSRTDETPEMTMGGLHGVGALMAVAFFILIALAGFAKGYSRTDSPTAESLLRAQPAIAWERAALMDPGELAPVMDKPTPKLAAKLEAGPVIATEVMIAEPIVSPAAAEAAAPVLEPAPGPV